jgi:hypothetical protein
MHELNLIMQTMFLRHLVRLSIVPKATCLDLMAVRSSISSLFAIIYIYQSGVLIETTEFAGTPTAIIELPSDEIWVGTSLGTFT